MLMGSSNEWQLPKEGKIIICIVQDIFLCNSVWACLFSRRKCCSSKINRVNWKMLILQINTRFFIRKKKSIKCSETALIKVCIFQLVINLIQLSLGESINLYFPSCSTFFHWSCVGVFSLVEAGIPWGLYLFLDKYNDFTFSRWCGISSESHDSRYNWRDKDVLGPSGKKGDLVCRRLGARVLLKGNVV